MKNLPKFLKNYSLALLFTALVVASSSVVFYRASHTDNNPQPIPGPTLTPVEGQQTFGAITLWYLDGTVLKPVDSSWTASVAVTGSVSTNFEVTGSYASISGDFVWFGELLPDGLTCSDGQILKKTGANDWDCATDDTGGGFSWPFTKQADNSQGTTTVMSFLGGFYSSASSTLTDFQATNGRT